MNRHGICTMVLCAGALVGAMFPTGAMGQTRPSTEGKATPIAKDLADYLQDAQQLGLNNDELRLNAIRAGWKPNVVDEALKTLPPTPNTDEPRKPERADRGVPDEYIIGEGDIISVVVYKERDASTASVAVLANGKATLPFLKDVVVAGLTPAQTEKLITTKLRPYINEPDVTVVVREVHAKGR